MAQRRGGLGRGLDALIQGPASSDRIQEIDIDAIGPNPRQPRQRIDDQALTELADSIRTHGVIQPVIVARSSGAVPYQLVAGERRWRAARLAGLRTIPAIVRDATPRDALELALIENVQRADLTPIEEAQAYHELIEEFGLTQAEIAQRVGKSRAAVANTLRLLQAPAPVQEALSSGQITEGHARALLGLTQAADQLAALAMVIEQGLTVRQTEELVRRWQRAPARRPVRYSPLAEVQQLEEAFRRALGTKVELRPGRQGGRLVIHYFSEEELDALYRRLVGDVPDA
ncbi:Chromosome-partitioning protein Spo0J [bacterium HR26]|nr:Chromosome-partitioning protein Spo0J [bacterium HR26]